MLGSFGVGSVLGALGISAGRNRPTAESSVRINTLVLAGAVIVIALSRWRIPSAVALIVAGTAWLSLANLFNVSVQMLAPRWVTGRTLATYQAAISGGVAVGSWIWGLLAGIWSVNSAMLCAGLAIGLLPLLARWQPMPLIEPDAREMAAARDEPRVALDLTVRSGPIIITVEYRVDPAEARDFYAAIRELQLARRRNGARDWSIARDIDDPWLWTERFQCATWLEFLRHRDRPTRSERELQRRVLAFHRVSDPVQVRRMLGRPLGSVRWKQDVPDAKADEWVAHPPGSM
jgi:hypothetical protein